MLSMNLPRLLIPGLVAISALLVGCSSDESNGCETVTFEDGDVGVVCPEDTAPTTTPDAVTLDGSAPVSPFTVCIDSTDCRGGEICTGGFCREACSSSDPCTGALRACDTSAGLCVGCVTSDDCAVSERCVSRTCEFFCTEDEHCPQPLYCNFEDGTCFEAECLTDAECSGGFRCGDLRCVPIGGSSVECVSDSDCRGGFRCADSRCVQIGG